VDLFTPLTPQWLAIIANSANRTTTLPASLDAGTLSRLLADDAISKPPNLNAESRLLAARYAGDQRLIIERAIKERYPSSSKMPVAPLNFVRLWARQDSGAYAEPATRYLVDDSGEQLPEGDARVDAFDDIVRRSRIDEVAPEAERRSLTGVRSIAAHVGYLPPVDGGVGRPVIHLYWPHDVVALCHPSIPSEEEGLWLVALRQTSPDPTLTAWTVYAREPVLDGDTVSAWGPWQYARIVERDTGVVVPEEYPGSVLPVAFLRIEQPDGGFWPAPERDVGPVSDSLNVSRSNLQHVSDLQAHSLLAISSDRYDADESPIGPDAAIKLNAGESISYVTPAPAFGELREGIEETQRAIATTRGNNPSAYSARPGPAESGIARQIANLPHERRLGELRPVIQRWDERVCTILVDVADTFDESVPTIGEGVVTRTELAPTKTFEDPESKQRRLALDLDLGVISLAQYAVAMGHYSSIAAAKEAGLPDTPRAALATAIEADTRTASSLPMAPERETAPAAVVDTQPTINELTLGIERLGRLGDTDALNILRRKMASILGVEVADVTASTLASDASTVAEAVGDKPTGTPPPAGE
jgi:hypothetical protein